SEPVRTSTWTRPMSPQRSLLLHDSRLPHTPRPLDRVDAPSSPEATPNEGHALPNALPPLESLDAAGRARDRQRQPTWSEVRFIAQVRETYLICEGQDGLYVLDQHAASERVLFSKLHRQYRSQGVAAQ